MRRPSTIITAAVGGVVAGALLVGGGAAVGAAVYDAQNAHKVDGRHAVGAGASSDARKGRLVAADATGKLPAGAIPRQVVFTSKYGTSFVNTTSSTPATVTGASASVTMPKAGRLAVTFSAESVCSGSSGSGWCGVNVLVDGVLAPGEDDDAFDSDDNATETSASWESHSVTRVIPVAKGAHTVVVKSYSANGGATFELDDWTLTVLGIL
jgi:hypothetical protein